MLRTKSGGQADEQQERAAQRHAEAEDGHGRGHAHLEDADERERQELADEQLPRPDRRDDDLLHRADLLLAHDAHRGEQHRHDHEDHGEDGGHVEPAALQVGVVEDARDERDRARARAAGQRAQPRLQRLRAHVAHERARVAEGDVRGGGVGAVDDELHGRRPAAGQRGAEALADHEAELGLRRDEPAVDLVGAVVGGDDLEVARLQEPAHEVAARRAAVLVDEHGRHVRDVRVHREAEDDDLHDRRDEDDGDHLPVAPDLQELLHDDAPEGVHVRPPAARGAGRRAPRSRGRRGGARRPAASRWRGPRPSG